MRIILKPAGLLIVGLSFLLLVSLVIYDRFLIQRSYAESADSVPAPAAAVAAAPQRPPVGPAAAPAPPPTYPDTLENAGFEGDFRPLDRYDGPAHLRGEIAAPWRDDSSWATVSALYADDTTHAHSGSSCQRVEVQSAAAGAVQLIQTLTLPVGHVYRASVWLRTDRPTTIEVGVREQNKPFEYYGKTDQKIGPEWTQVQVQARVQKAEPTLFIVRVMDPCNLLVDDAALTDIGGQ